jgi:ATP-dependent Lhr-like helicase
MDHRVINVDPAPGGRVPPFTGAGGLVHDRLRQEMRAIYMKLDAPPFLDTCAVDILREGRDNFVNAGLGSSLVVGSGASTLLYPWLGDRALNTLALELHASGYSTAREGVAALMDLIFTRFPLRCLTPI